MQNVTIFIFFCFLTQKTQLISKSFLTNISDSLSGHYLLLYLHRTFDFCCCCQSVGVHLNWWDFTGHLNTWLIQVNPCPLEWCGWLFRQIWLRRGPAHWCPDCSYALDEWGFHEFNLRISDVSLWHFIRFLSSTDLPFFFFLCQNWI